MFIFSGEKNGLLVVLFSWARAKRNARLIRSRRNQCIPSDKWWETKDAFFWPQRACYAAPLPGSSLETDLALMSTLYSLQVLNIHPISTRLSEETSVCAIVWLNPSGQLSRQGLPALKPHRRIRPQSHTPRHDASTQKTFSRFCTFHPQEP